MGNTWLKSGGAIGAVLVPLLAGPAMAAGQGDADHSGWTQIAADELNQRSKAPAPAQKGGMSERGVRNMVSYASYLIPDEVVGPNGEKIIVDKSDPSKFAIPEDLARRVIRASTRSAYADVCGLPELGQANFNTMMALEKKNNWSDQQVLMIKALHVFAVSFFTGKSTFSSDAEGSSAAAEGGEATQAEQAPKKELTCSPEQKVGVENAIKEYVATANAQ